MRKQAHRNEWCGFEPRPSPVSFQLTPCCSLSISTVAVSCPFVEWKVPFLSLPLFSSSFKSLHALLPYFFIKLLLIPLYKEPIRTPCCLWWNVTGGIYCCCLMPPSLSTSLTNSKWVHQGWALFSLSLALFTTDSKPSINILNLETDWRQNIEFTPHVSIVNSKFCGNDDWGNNKISIKHHMAECIGMWYSWQEISSEWKMFAKYKHCKNMCTIQALLLDSQGFLFRSWRTCEAIQFLEWNLGLLSEINPGKPFCTWAFLESLWTSILTHLNGGTKSQNKITTKFCLLPALVVLEIFQGKLTHFISSPLPLLLPALCGWSLGWSTGQRLV